MKKNVIIVILLLTNIFLGNAQVTPTTPIIPLDGDPNNPAYSNPITTTESYYKDVDHKFDQWVGTWQYENGSTLIKIVITKIEAIYVPANTFNGRSTYCYVDLLNGGYYYKENGIVKTNHLIYSNQFEPPLFCRRYQGSNPNKLTIYYREIDKSPNLTGTTVYLTLLPESTTQATWVFDSTKKRNYSVPDNVVLTKL